VLKINVTELEQAIALLKKRSTDVHCTIRQASPESLTISFTSVDGELITVEIWTESTRNFAKVSSTERLGEVLKRSKV
jgi:hypothetical protein